MPGLIERNQSGRKQDISDLIAVADKRSTPFITMIKKGKKPTNVNFSWQADNFDAPKYDGVLDGKDADTFENAAENRAELNNRLQIFRRTAQVSKLAQDVSDVAGIGQKQEFAKAKVKKMIEVKRDMEAAFLSDNGSQVDDGSKPNLTRGLGKWIQNGAQSDGSTDVPSGYRTPTASIDATATASLTEALFQGVMKSIFEQTGERKRMVLLCGTALKQQITSFTRYETGVSSSIASVRTFNQQAKDKTIQASVEFYSGDFAEVEIMPDLWTAYRTSAGVLNSAAIRNGRGYLIDPSDLEIRVNENPYSKDLEDQGGGPRALIEAIAGLCVGNPLKHGKFAPTA